MQYGVHLNKKTLFFICTDGSVLFLKKVYLKNNSVFIFLDVDLRSHYLWRKIFFQYLSNPNFSKFESKYFMGA
jgi:hypothetical protein